MQHPTTDQHTSTQHTSTSQPSSSLPIGFYDTLDNLLNTTGGLLDIGGDIRLIIARGAVTVLGLLALIGGGVLLVQGVMHTMDVTDTAKRAAL
jgi:hypothetical protein